ncbi:MAG: methionine--tRNA ligase [Acidimicrobiia bacterium]|nr:methionine--tRNA ligase [Acidimicrobiia bacterium]
MSKKVLVAVAWPYAQGSLHLGHMAGAYLPADIFARYQRAIGNDVLMVSGSDAHGTPITVRAEEEGVTPQEIVDRYHPEFLGYWRDLGITFDLFTRTDTDTHHRVAQEFFLKLLENGYMYTATSEQYFDEEVGEFLPDRYVEGTCPHCGYEHARGDQCDNCGRTLDPTDLINPRSKRSGSTPVLRETEHYYWKLSEFGDQLLDWLGDKQGWRPHVINFAKGMIEDGLIDRAFTRDISWGIPLPVDDLGDGKRIYVWWEAVMGYFSAPQEWAELRGEPDAWKPWWTDPDAESYYFVGKDNIPFHAVFWPALLMGYGGLNLPTNVPANQYVTFKGEKASKSRGVGRPLQWYLEHFEPDALRYALAANLPETSDSDLTEAELVRRVNDELVAAWGNLVNRVISMTHRYFEGVVPSCDVHDETDEALLEKVRSGIDEVGADIQAVRLKSGLNKAMAMAQAANVYLSEREPWQTAKTDMERTGITLGVALNAIAGIAVALGPYLPFTTPRVFEMLGLETEQHWHRPVVATGTQLGPVDPLFAKVDAEMLDAD